MKKLPSEAQPASHGFGRDVTLPGDIPLDDGGDRAPQTHAVSTSMATTPSLVSLRRLNGDPGSWSQAMMH